MDTQSTPENNEERCEHCGANLKKFWHRLTPGMTNALIKARRYVAENPSSRNEFHIYKHLTRENTLTTVEQMNWTKLRFHGLVAKVRREGKVKTGYWLITRRGADFLNGEIQIPQRVQTFRNRVVARSEEMVTIKDVIGAQPYWDKKEEYLYSHATEEDMENIVTSIKKKKLKKGQEKCPRCGDILSSRLQSKPNEAGTAMTIERWKQCPSCKYETPKT